MLPRRQKSYRISKSTNSECGGHIRKLSLLEDDDFWSGDNHEQRRSQRPRGLRYTRHRPDGFFGLIRGELNSTLLMMKENQQLRRLVSFWINLTAQQQWQVIGLEQELVVTLQGSMVERRLFYGGPRALKKEATHWLNTSNIFQMFTVRYAHLYSSSMFWRCAHKLSWEWIRRTLAVKTLRHFRSFFISSYISVSFPCGFYSTFVVFVTRFWDGFLNPARKIEQLWEVWLSTRHLK